MLFYVALPDGYCDTWCAGEDSSGDDNTNPDEERYYTPAELAEFSSLLDPNETPPRLEGSDRLALQRLLPVFLGGGAAQTVLPLSEELSADFAAGGLIAAAERFVFGVRKWQSMSRRRRPPATAPAAGRGPLFPATASAAGRGPLPRPVLCLLRELLRGVHRSDSCLPKNVFDIRQNFNFIPADDGSHSYSYVDPEFSFSKKFADDKKKNTIPKVLHMLMHIASNLPGAAAPVRGEHQSLLFELRSREKRRQAVSEFVRAVLEEEGGSEEDGGAGAASTEGGPPPAWREDDALRDELDTEIAPVLFPAGESQSMDGSASATRPPPPDGMNDAESKPKPLPPPFWICRLERDSYFLPANFRKAVLTVAAPHKGWHYFGVSQYYEAWNGERPWVDGGPGLCLSSGALARLSLYLTKIEHHFDEQFYPGYYSDDPEHAVLCQPNLLGHREDRMLSRCLSEAGVYPATTFGGLQCVV